MTQMSQMDRDPRTFAVIGAAMEVHSHLGAGFLEAVYQETLEIELGLRGIPFESQVPLLLDYKGVDLKTSYRPDLFCFGTLLVELKAQKSIGDVELAQVVNYLRASKTQVGLLLNFGAPRLEYRRVVLGASEFQTSSAPSASSAVG